jgi:hypothetical protein
MPIKCLRTNWICSHSKGQGYYQYPCPSFFLQPLNKQDKTKRLWDMFLNLYILTISLV